MSVITQIPIDDLNGLCVKTGMKGLTDKEYQFLWEFCIVMKSLTDALDILQGQYHCYYGILLHTLEVLMSKTFSLKAGLSRLATWLPNVIVHVSQTINTSFIHNHINDKSYFIHGLQSYTVRMLHVWRAS